MCGNGNGIGHIPIECPNEVVCFECHKPGHKRGSPLCQGLDTMDNDTVDADNDKQDVSEEDGDEVGKKVVVRVKKKDKIIVER